MKRRIRQNVESEMPRGLTEASLHALIAHRAHEHFIARGGADGRALEDWLFAEHQVLDELRQGTADTESSGIDADDEVRETEGLPERLHA